MPESVNSFRNPRGELRNEPGAPAATKAVVVFPLPSHRELVVQPGCRPDTSVTARPETWVTLRHALGRDRSDGRATAIRDDAAQAQDFIQEPLHHLRGGSKDWLQVAASVRRFRPCGTARPLSTP